VARALYRDALGLTSRFRPATDHRTSGTISYVLANWRPALPNEGCAESTEHMRDRDEWLYVLNT
jgi:hypothetical protein